MQGFYYDKVESTDKTFKDQEDILKEHGYIKKDDIFITTASMPIKEKGRTNALKINVCH